jgi:hypothetical protein
LSKWIKNIAAIGLGVLIAAVIAEIFLHFYNPFKSRIHGKQIVLPVNVKYEFKDQKIRGLDAQIVHTKNSLGFRGPELPTDPKTIKILCVGGSTTECFYLSDGKDWPALLMQKMRGNGQNVWINNAGLDGHSTFGHLILLRDHIVKLKPDIILFLVGCNDVAADGLNKFERYNLNKKNRFLENFELFNLFNAWRRSRNAAKMGMGHTPVDFSKWPKADTSGWQKVVDSWQNNVVKINLLNNFRKRLDSIKSICFDAGISLVFITQPTILSDYTDPITKRYLGNLLFQSQSALHYHAVLNAYNIQTQAMGQKMMDNNLNKFYWIIDAANMLAPSSENYYDFFHYTNKGAENMAQIIFNNWGKFIKKEK